MPGAVIPAKKGKIVLNKGRNRIKLKVTNKGDRAVQIGSHYSFIEANPQLAFDRIRAYGYHLDVPSGMSTRFEPGDMKTVTLVEIAGLRTITGGSSIASGLIDPSRVSQILRNIGEQGFQHVPEEPTNNEDEIGPYEMERSDYASMYGPTTGDLVRLGATDLWVKVEKDFTSHGDECTFGAGKTLRDGIGVKSGRGDAECLDMVITNALIIDWHGIIKADVGTKGGYIVGIGKAGNPDVMDGVDPTLVIGSNTDVISGEGKIITAGGIDTHVHLTAPQQAVEALATGITTQFAGGTGPSTATLAANCSPGKTHIRQIMQACDHLPMNFGILGKGSDSAEGGLHDQVKAGAAGLKIHEDWGCTPASIDTCLRVCDEHDIQCNIHCDSLNESGFVERTAAAFKDRTVHAYHIEGAGGGHAPDMISLVQWPNILPSSTSPTKPYTINTIEEHIDMVMSCHHLSKNIPTDVSFADSRVRAETIEAEDVLHDTGAISMMSSDSHAMGRCGEVILRTWHTAHKNKLQRGQLEGDKGTGADNHRVKRYISKYTINPAITQGISHVVGSVEVGKLADLVIWEPWNFGVKPFQVLKSGLIGLVTLTRPVSLRFSQSSLALCTLVLFVSKAGIDSGAVASYNLKKRIEVVKNCRTVKKHDMKYNGEMPEMQVDPETYVVTADGKQCKAEAVSSLPLAHPYFIY
ncbi:Urease [Knufia obscura]|uniref:urease n=1 Tax=Knufia obscura TaxID=1635080 RepID=A0ABR0R7Z4_9EURO|nr:Urease [Knufia obscura]